ncbi:hypothetical protein B0A55_09996 [Friedmanniomyces simplex]|uniref:Dynein light chain Tctex-type n=1 Tax=Friedmanniomyces simplex TaxID=329884 RepID=A0A4U0WW01_9PEZI|nr:hypothetical protein B0A55_09996 [Friedmanniomyces simplex]
MANSPVAQTRLKQICNDACDSTLSTASAYDHAQTAQWNNSIINSILKALISESSTSETSPKYKFCVNSTIIQHLSDPRPAGASETGAQTEVEGEGVVMGESGAAKKVGRRGMHSASGAYWNNEKDGMWSHKYEGGEAKGMDIVVSVMWIAV